MNVTKFDYRKEWAEVDSLREQGLPQTMLPKIDSIYNAAYAEKNYEQLIKALIYRMNSEDDEEGSIETVNRLKAEAQTLPLPAQAIIHSMLGQIYDLYEPFNSRSVRNRTYTVDASDDFHTWDSRRLREEAHKHYHLSLSGDKALQSVPVDDYKDILTPGFDTKIQPTMFDILASRALEFYFREKAPASNNPEYFVPAREFVAIDIADEADSLWLKTIQRLTRFHLDRLNSAADDDAAALIDLELRRITGMPDSDLSENALIRFGKEYEQYKANAKILLALANRYYNSGENRQRDGYLKAYEVCRQIERNYPGEVENDLSELKKRIKQINLEITIEDVQLPETPILALLKYRNIDTVYQTVYRLTGDEAVKYDNNQRVADFLKKINKTPVKSIISVPRQSDFRSHTTEIKIEALEKGIYLMLMSDTEDPVSSSAYSASLLQVSGLAVLSRKLPDDFLSITVTDRKTGVPVKAAEVVAYSGKTKLTALSNNNGYVSCKDFSGQRFYQVNHKGDSLTVFESIDNFRAVTGKSDRVKRSTIMTDRAIYRPGQTVYFKAILYDFDKEEINRKNLLKGEKVTVSLLDYNRRPAGELKLVSNEFGSIDGSFVIPQGALNGFITISCQEYGEEYILVEEYKRPTFEVKFDAVKGNYSFNDTVKATATAKAFAGYAIDNADVSYSVERITRQRYYRWWMNIPDQYDNISSGSLKTDEKGNVTIEFTTLPDDLKDDCYYTYTVTADVTDASGETQSASVDINAGKNPLLIRTNLEQKIRKGKLDDYTVETVNLNGEPTPASVTVEIVSLKSPEKPLRKRVWQEEPDVRTIDKEQFRRDFPLDAYENESNPSKLQELEKIAAYKLPVTSDPETKLDLSALNRSGYYKIILTAAGDKGHVATDTQYVYLAGDAADPIRNMDEWLTVIKDGGEPGEKVEFLLAGGEAKSYVYCELTRMNRIIESKWIETGTVPVKASFLIREEYRGGFELQFYMVQNNRLYYEIKQVKVPFTNKELDVTLSTFRDKLLPGENEVWTMKVTDRNGHREIAEVAATLYDASLDAFIRHHWPGISSFYWNTSAYYGLRWHAPSIQMTKHTRSYQKEHFYDRRQSAGYGDINWYDNIQFYGAGVSLFRKTVARSMMSEEMMLMEESKVYAKENITASYAEMASGKDAVSGTTDYGSSSGYEEDDDSAARLSQVATRTNFNETAFFYPRLRTNEAGEVLIEFTMPEALTRWKLLSFAHTSDLKAGSYTNELITQKQVAISANPPRFFREGDTVYLAAKVNNLTETSIKGRALLRLYDAATMQPADSIILDGGERQATFDVASGESVSLKWRLHIPKGLQAVTYKVTAEAGTHSDGEEKTVPVLANSMLVTETLPFSIRAGQEKSLTFDRLTSSETGKSTTLRNHRLTLEFTSAPAWYAVQAMPYMMEYPYECAEQTFSRYYANALASAIINRTPRIKQVFELWRTSGASSSALISKLEQNSELKQIALEETPWLVEAENESENRKRIALLFDLNRMTSEMDRTFDHLTMKAQNDDGGFPWFEGNPSNRYITQHIVSGMAHLRKLGALQAKNADVAERMTQRGLEYLDREIEKDFKSLKYYKADRDKRQINQIQLHYLYACSFSGHKPAGSAKDAFDYYLRQTDKFWNTFSTYEKALAALVLYRYGQTDRAQGIIRSLKEFAQQSDEMGMYWKDNRSGYFWYQAPIETQAALIESFGEVAQDMQSVEEMKIWLLRNKQTNNWKTTKATSEAIYALLATGADLLDESKTLEVEIAGKPLGEISSEAGTGYVKTSWAGADVTRNMGFLKVKNPNSKGIAFGGMYWQYFEQLDKIRASETGLGMNRQLYLRKITAKGEELHPVTVLRTGDLVRVRIEIRATRDYEYVHLKDMRAACFEPVSVMSGHKYRDGLFYYESIKDASTNFFITNLPKGTYVFEYDLRVAHEGDFAGGITTFQCMYAPEYSSHSEGIRVKVK
ncbi:MAG: hypothetical protein LBT42_04575 [Tannerella sp.]|jgi:uncharacterized protein YfaS (alpha-2-macroglobulin family)|nr:hypothetical protein [Tannerella sp.]